ncbi:hypothetical protein PP1Y_AT13939 [Novosphingobium sp. PP1Y]|nr:hypothetical protein PP1Y_AT13939 [Novosphingobium sp. PP1Y]
MDHHGADAVVEWPVRCTAMADVVEQAHADAGQERLDQADFLHLPHIDSNVELPVEVEADIGIGRTDFAKHYQQLAKLGGHVERRSGLGEPLSFIGQHA